MALHGTYEPDNIFAKIIAGDMPCVNVFEDDIALAFMDIFPQSRGHTLVIPKGVHARNFLEMPADQLGPYMLRVQTVAIAVEKALAPDGLRVMQFNGAPAGQTVFHLHFHIIPIWTDTSLTPHAGGQQADINELERIAQTIRAAL